MKILFLTNIPSPYNTDLFESLGDRVDLTVFYYAALETDRSWDIKIENKKYQIKIFNDNFFSKMVRRKFSGFYCSVDVLSYLRSDADAVVVSGNYYAPNSLVAFIYFKLMGKKVYWYGEKLFHSRGVKSIVKRILLAPICFLSDAIFAIGDEAITSYRYHGYNKDICRVHYAINNEKFLGFNNVSLRNKLKNDGKFIFLTSGSLINRKGIDLAINAYLALDDHQRTLAELWIIGDGPEKQSLMDLAKSDLGVKFFGFVQPDLVSKYFSLATAFIFPTRYDGWGVVLNEAIAFGLPIIVSDAAVSSELICDGINGYVCKSDCLLDYITAMRILLSDPNIVHAMRMKNIEISSSIDSSVVANKILSKITCDI